MEEDKTENMIAEAALSEHVALPQEFKYLVKVLMTLHLFANICWLVIIRLWLLRLYYRFIYRVCYEFVNLL